jgi:DNA-binding transcriptional ArsR family regulator
MRMAAGQRWLPPIRDLARELEVHPRTVRRDLEALEAAHVVALPLDGDRALSLAGVSDTRYVLHAPEVP